MAVSQKDWKQPNRRIWLAKIDIDRGRVLTFALKKLQTKKYEQIGLFLLEILNGRTSRQRGNLASKENKQTLAIWVQPRKLRAKMKSVLRSFCKHRNPETLSTKLRAT